MPVYPFPPSWPAQEIADSISAITAGTLASKHEVHCVWSIIGYGLSVIAPDPAPTAKTAPVKVVKLPNATPQGVAEHLTANAANPTAIDWPSVIKILISLVMAFFGL